MAEIQVNHLPLSVLIGTKPSERTRKQKLFIHYSFIYPCAAVKKSDCLKDAVDYEALSAKIIAKAQKTQFFLIESLAHYILNLIMSEKRIQSATIRIDKPTALGSRSGVSVILSANQQRKRQGKQQGTPTKPQGVRSKR